MPERGQAAPTVVAVETAPEGSGVLLVRAWMHGDQLVARLRWSVAPESGQRAEVVVGADQVTAAVRRWLAEIADGP